VLVLIGIGLLAGIITSISPCVLPVLPILLAGGATGRKPLRIIAGLVLSFAVFTLFASWLLSRLGLPQDLLRNAAIALLFVVAVTLLVPRAALIVERPLAAFSRLRPAAGGGFWFGATLALVFVPCAGPVLAAVTVAAANQTVGIRALVLTFSYAAGAAIPMLAIAAGGRAASTRIRARATLVRTGSGLVIGLVALGLVFHLDDHLAQLTPAYTSFLQRKLEDNGTAKRALAHVTGATTARAAVKPTVAGDLPDYGAAPEIRPGGGAWINSKPLTLEALRGRVVLIDFWTYSCINCLRTLPHLKAWWAAYHARGLTIIGVHTPEFAFEHVTSNVEAAVKRLGIAYPVVQDNEFGTWDAYSNEYWPAEYLIDRNGRIRHVHFGEGSYDETESDIARLLGTTAKPARSVADATPTEATTPETYLGYKRLERYAGSALVPGRAAAYRFPPGQLAQNALAYAGTWTVGPEEIVAGNGARLRIHVHAENVYIVLGGRGRVAGLIDGKPAGSFAVDGSRLYTVRASKRLVDGTLELRFTPGVQAYSFTFG